MRVLCLILAVLMPLPLMAQEFSASRTLPVGTIISAADLRPLEAGATGPVEASGLVGLQTRITIYEGRPVKANLLRQPILVNRNQIVRIVYQRGALRIVTEGRSLDQGSAGDLIRVMNLDSRNTVTALIEADGSLRITN